MTWLDDQVRLQKMANEVDKSVRLTTKDSLFWQFMAVVLGWLHIMPALNFLRNFATTIGPVIAFPKHWTTGEVERTLDHELVHVRQARKCSLGLSPWLGLPIYAIAYLFLPLPFGLAYCRFHFELEAEKVRWYRMFKEGTGLVVISSLAEDWANMISGSSYGWCMPRKYVLKEANDTVGNLFMRCLGELPPGSSVKSS
jgi:hypothetical protein